MALNSLPYNAPGFCRYDEQTELLHKAIRYADDEPPPPTRHFDCLHSVNMWGVFNVTCAPRFESQLPSSPPQVVKNRSACEQLPTLGSQPWKGSRSSSGTGVSRRMQTDFVKAAQDRRWRAIPKARMLTIKKESVEPASGTLFLFRSVTVKLSIAQLSSKPACHPAPLANQSMSRDALA